MRWEGRRQSDNIEDRRGMRISRGGMVGGGIGTIAIALLVIFLGGDPTAVLQGVGEGPVQTTNEPYTESPKEEEWRQFRSPSRLPRPRMPGTRSSPDLGGQYREPIARALHAGGRVGLRRRRSRRSGRSTARRTRRSTSISASSTSSRPARSGAAISRAPTSSRTRSAITCRTCAASRARCTSCSSARLGDVEANQLSVRLELQADCYAGLWAQRVDEYESGILEPGDIEEALGAASAIGDDTLQRSAGRAVVPDSFTHGSSEQRKRWFMAGFDSGSLEACDTFKAADL